MFILRSNQVYLEVLSVLCNRILVVIMLIIGGKNRNSRLVNILFVQLLIFPFISHTHLSSLCSPHDMRVKGHVLKRIIENFILLRENIPTFV